MAALPGDEISSWTTGCKWVSSFLTTQQHVKGHSMPILKAKLE